MEGGRGVIYEDDLGDNVEVITYAGSSHSQKCVLSAVMGGGAGGEEEESTCSGDEVSTHTHTHTH